MWVENTKSFRVLLLCSSTKRNFDMWAILGDFVPCCPKVGDFFWSHTFCYKLLTYFQLSPNTKLSLIIFGQNRPFQDSNHPLKSKYQKLPTLKNVESFTRNVRIQLPDSFFNVYIVIQAMFINIYSGWYHSRCVWYHPLHCTSSQAWHFNIATRQRIGLDGSVYLAFHFEALHVGQDLWKLDEHCQIPPCTIVRRTLACSPSTCSDTPAAISRTEARARGGCVNISFPTKAAPTNSASWCFALISEIRSNSGMSAPLRLGNQTKAIKALKSGIRYKICKITVSNRASSKATRLFLAK